MLYCSGMWLEELIYRNKINSSKSMECNCMSIFFRNCSVCFKLNSGHIADRHIQKPLLTICGQQNDIIYRGFFCVYLCFHAEWLLIVPSGTWFERLNENKMRLKACYIKCHGLCLGDHLYIKMPYRDSHVKDKTVSPTVLSLTRESPYWGKTVFILRRGPRMVDRSTRTYILCNTQLAF